MEKRNKKNGIKFYVVISLALLLGVAGIIQIGRAQQEGITDLTAFASSVGGNAEAFQAGLAYLSDKMMNLGANPGGDFTNPVTFYDKVGFGDGNNTVNTFHKIIRFTDATITAAIFNPDLLGYNDFYLEDVWVENTSKATSTSIRLCVTTTTAEFISGDNPALLKEDAGECTLIRGLGGAFGSDAAAFDGLTATSSQFDWFRYPGSNTYVGTQINHLLVNSTTNVLVFATTSADRNYGIIGTGNTFDGLLHVIGIESKR
jgi:hypothetical protein